MKVMSAIACLPAALIILAVCNNSEVKAAPAPAPYTIPARAPETVDPAVQQAQVKMLRALLGDDGGEDETRLRNNCTRRAIKQLIDDYDYDDTDGTSLAVWAFNGRPVGADFTKIAVSSINCVVPNTYWVVLNITCDDYHVDTVVMEYTLAREGGRWKVDSYRYVTNYCTRSY